MFYTNPYVRCRITALDENRNFINLLEVKSKTNLEVYGFLKRVEKFTKHIHKIRVMKHDETLRIIGIDIQVKDSFPIVAYNKCEHRVKYPLQLGHKLDKYCLGKDRTFLNEIRGYLLFNHEMLSYPVHQQVTEEDRFREALRQQNPVKMFSNTRSASINETYNQGRTKHVSQVVIIHRKKKQF